MQEKDNENSTTESSEAALKHDAAVVCRILGKYACRYANQYIAQYGVIPAPEKYEELFSGAIEVLLRKERGMEIDDC